MKLFDPLRFSIWAVCAIGLAYLTVNDFLILLTDYKANNLATETFVSKIENDPGLNVSVCLPYHSGALSTIARWLSRQDPKICMECDAMQNHTWDVWNQFSVEGRKTIDENVLAIAILKNLLEYDDFDWLIQNATNFNWNEAIFDSIWKLFACIFVQDSKYVTSLTVKESVNICAGFDLDVVGAISKETMEKLFLKALSAVDTYLKIDVHTSNGTTVRDTLRDRYRTLAVRPEHVCLAIRPGSKRETFRFASFHDNSTLAPWARSMRPDVFLVIQDSTVLYSFMNSYSTIYPKGMVGIRNSPFRTKYCSL